MNNHTGIPKKISRWTSVVTTALFITVTAGCGVATIIGGPINQPALRDGVYRGCDKHGPNKAIVEVEVRDQRVTEVRIIHHSAWRGRRADPIIPHYIVQNQSTAVDVVSGATNSSHVIMNAAHNAILESYKGGPESAE